MTARDDYPILAHLLVTLDQVMECECALDEIDELRSKVEHKRSNDGSAETDADLDLIGYVHKEWRR